MARLGIASLGWCMALHRNNEWKVLKDQFEELRQRESGSVLDAQETFDDEICRRFGEMISRAAVGKSEWQILRPSLHDADTLGFVWAATKDEALELAIEQLKLSDPPKNNLVAVRVLDGR